MASRVVVYASSSPVQGQRPESQRVRSSTGAHVNVFPTRKLVQQGLLSGLAAAAMVLSSGPALAESMTFTFEKPEIKEKLKERDTAMDFQCKGGMFDCDGDRREFAKKQYKNFEKRLTDAPTPSAPETPKQEQQQ